MKGYKKVSTFLSAVFLANIIICSCISTVVFAATTMTIGLKNWTGTLTNANGTVYLDATEKYHGNYSAKITMDKTPTMDDQMRLNLSIAGLMPGKTYRLGYAAKAQNAQYIQTTMENISVWIAVSVEYGTYFDWTEFEFEFSVPDNTSTTTTGRFVLFSKAQCDAFWIDDMYCYEYTNGNMVGNNLIQNPGFEDGGTAPIIKNDDEPEIDTFNDITSKDALIAKKAENISIDGKFDDWNQYEKHPIVSYDAIVDKDKTIDATIQYCYDEDAFYYLLEITDDQHVFVEGSRYWSGDGVQSVIDNNNSNGYGEPIGYYYNDEKDEVVFITDNGGSQIESGLSDNPSGKGKRNGEKTYYEIKIPWKYLGMECPQKVKFNLIINDNDNGVRLGWLEIAPGIGRTKSNAEYPYLVLGNNGGGISSIVIHNNELKSGEKPNATVSYSNVRIRDVEVEIKIGDYEKSVVVPSMQKFNTEVTLQISNSVGTIPIEAQINDGDNTYLTLLNVTVIPDDEFVSQFVASITSWVKELKEYRDECKSRGIATEYENADIRLLETYIETIPWEISNNSEGYKRVAHFYDVLPKIYEECKNSLIDLLNGKKMPVDVPEFVTSDVSVRNGAFWAMVEKNGVLYESPVTFNGICGYSVPEDWISDIAEYGMNHVEIGIYGNQLVRWNGYEIEPIPENERFGKRNDEYAMERVLASLEECNKNGVSVTLMVNAMAWPNLKSYITDYAHSTNHTYNPFNVNHPMVEVVADAVYKEIGEICKEYPCIDGICMLNEPTVKLAGNPYYDDQWAAFLSNRYDGDIAKLNDAYDSEYIAFSQIPMPETISYCVQYHDYRMFCEDVYGQFIKTLTTAARKYTNLPLSVKEMQRSRMYNSDYTIAFATTLEKNYKMLDLAGCDAFYLPNRSDLSLDIKMMWYDYITSITESPVQNGEDHIGTDGQGGNDVFYDDSSYKSSSWQGMIHGGGIQDNWHYLANDRMKSTAKGDEEFEPYVHLLKLPNSLRDLYTNNFDALRLAYEVNALVTAPRNVGILWSNTTWSYSPKFMNGLYRAYQSTIQNGQRAKFITEYTLEQLEEVKILIIPGSVNVLPETVDAIEMFIKSGGSVIMLGETSLGKDDYNKPNDENKIEYIRNNSLIIESDVLGNSSSINLPENYEQIITEEFINKGLMDVVVIDKETGEKVSNVEWIHNVYDGNMIINPFNYDKSDAKTVEIYINGKKARDIYDIKNNKHYGSEIRLEPLEPYLIKIESTDFCDMEGFEWASDAVYTLRDKGVISGIGGNKFAPSEFVTREQLAKMLVCCASLQTANSSIPFVDVNQNEWYSPYVSAIYSSGITEGISSDLFGVGHHVTRQDFVTMTYKTAKVMDITSFNNVTENNLVDLQDCSQYAMEAVEYCVSNGIISGNENNLFMPKNFCTRAEAAMILYNMFFK